MSTITIHLVEEGREVTITTTIGAGADDLVDAFRLAALAFGFHPDTVKEYFPDE